MHVKCKIERRHSASCWSHSGTPDGTGARQHRIVDWKPPACEVGDNNNCCVWLMSLHGSEAPLFIGPGADFTQREIQGLNHVLCLPLLLRPM